MNYSDDIYKPGELVYYIDLHIECTVLQSSPHDIEIQDNATGVTLWVSPNKITHDYQFQRNEKLKSLGIL